MTAMPAEKLPFMGRMMDDWEIEERTKLDLLILTVAYYRELAFEHPMTMIYRHLLEEAQRSLSEAEKRLRVRATV